MDIPSRQIGEQMGASDRLVCAWVFKARKFLQSRPDARSMAAAYQSTWQQKRDAEG